MLQSHVRYSRISKDKMMLLNALREQNISLITNLIVPLTNTTHAAFVRYQLFFYTIMTLHPDMIELTDTLFTDVELITMLNVSSTLIESIIQNDKYESFHYLCTRYENQIKDKIDHTRMMKQLIHFSAPCIYVTTFISMFCKNNVRFHNELALLECATKNTPTSLTIMRELLSKTDVDVHFNNDQALKLATENGYYPAVCLLIEEGGANIYNSNNYALRIAASRGYLDIVKYLVSKGADVAANNNFAVSHSAGKGFLDVVTFLVEHGADISVEYHQPFRWACENGHINVVKYLMEMSPNTMIDTIRMCKYNEDEMALCKSKTHYGIMEEPKTLHSQSMIHMLEPSHDSDVYRRTIPSTHPMQTCSKYCLQSNEPITSVLSYVFEYSINYASLYGHDKIIEYILSSLELNNNEDDHESESESGRNIKQKKLHFIIDTNNEVPVTYACRYGYVRILRVLSKYGFSLSFDNNLPLVSAAQNGHTSIVRYLLKNGVTPNFVEHEWNCNTYLYLYTVFSNNYYRTFSTIIKHRDAELTRDVVMDLTWKAVAYNKLNIVKIIFDHCMKRNCVSIVEREIKATALIIACQYGYISIVTYIIEVVGINVDIYNNKPLVTACSWGQMEVAMYLIQNGADIHVDNDTPLIAAATVGASPRLTYVLITLFNMDVRSLTGVHMNENVRLFLEMAGVIIPTKYLDNNSNIQFRQTNICNITHDEIVTGDVLVGCGTCLNVFKRDNLDRWFSRKYECPFRCSSSSFYYVTNEIINDTASQDIPQNASSPVVMSILQCYLDVSEDDDDDTSDTS